MNLNEQVFLQDKEHLLSLLSKKNIYHIHELNGLDKTLDVLLSNVVFSDKLHLFITIQSHLNFSGILLMDKSIETYLHHRQVRELFLRILRKTSDMLEKAQLYHDTYLQKLQSEQLLGISQLITSTLDIDEVLNRIMESIKTLVNYDAGSIFLMDDTGIALKRKFSVGYDPRKENEVQLKINQGIVGQVIRTRKPSYIPDVSLSSNYYPIRESTRSQLTLPIFIGDTIIGAIALESDKLNGFSQHDMLILQSFVGHASIAINNAQLYAEIKKKKEMENDLVIAANVQKSLLPVRIPRFHGIDMAVMSIPSKIVGGDFYDVGLIDDHRLFFSIGDVSGKGAAGSILMAVCLAGLRSINKKMYDVCEITARLNNLLCETTTPGRYVTLFMGVLDINEKKITYTNAGHNSPFLLKMSGEAHYLQTGGIVAGFKENFSYDQEHLAVEHGDCLVMYTDGIIESKNSSGEEFGIDRLIHIFAQHAGEPAAELKTIVLEELKLFTGNDEFDDDLSLFIVKM
ncbi:MAG: hypothetical protein Kow00108_08630 [Calditrichia bacterium]